MGRRRNKKKDNKPRLSEGETPHFNLPKNDYFLGFKLRRFNELWDWNTLEDVDFSTWKQVKNSNQKDGDKS